jgi:hypothetical protein
MVWQRMCSGYMAWCSVECKVSYGIPSQRSGAPAKRCVPGRREWCPVLDAMLIVISVGDVGSVMRAESDNCDWRNGFSRSGRNRILKGWC